MTEPKVYEANPYTDGLFDAFAAHCQTLWNYFEILKNQFFIETASGAGREYWDKELGLNTLGNLDMDPSDPDAPNSWTKRALNKSRAGGTCTETYLNRFLREVLGEGTEFTLTIDPPQYRVTIDIQTRPAYRSGIDRIIEAVIPAHLQLVINHSWIIMPTA